MEPPLGHSEATAAAPVPGVLTLDTDAKSLEVRADGIYETSNQIESKSDDASPDLAPASPKGVGDEEPASSFASPLAEPQASEQTVSSHAPPSDAVNALSPLERDEALAAGTGEPLSSSISTASEQPPVDAVPSRPRNSSPRAHDAAAECTSASAPQNEDSRRSDPKHSDGVVSEDVLCEVQAFLVDKIQENQLSSHAEQIHAFVAEHMSESQQRRQLPALVQRIVEHFRLDAQARGDSDVSVDVQSGICLLEHMFLSVGRVSPLQDMYTAEEEAMLDALALHSGRSDSGSANA